jgi:hypothetical protein
VDGWTSTESVRGHCGILDQRSTRAGRVPAADVLPFVALRRESIVLIEPTLSDEMIETPGSIRRTTPRDVTFLLGRPFGARGRPDPESLPQSKTPTNLSNGL